MQVIQFLYSLAILLPVSLQLFPSVRTMENGRFIRVGNRLECEVAKEYVQVCCLGHSAGRRGRVRENFLMVGKALMAKDGSMRLTALTTHVGCVIWRCLCAYMEAADIALGVFGVVAALHTTSQTIRVSVATFLIVG
jgi:hypothetical protein